MHQKTLMVKIKEKVALVFIRLGRLLYTGPTHTHVP
jgi:hypothetical protein